jgi:chromosome segregation ATPase
MSPITQKWLGRTLVASLVLGLIASAYGLYRLDTERKALHKEVESLTNRSELLQKKYNEQKAMTDTMRRTAQEIESRVRATSSNIAKLEKEKQQLETATAEHEKKFNEMRAACEETIANHEKRYAGLQTSNEQLREESTRIITEKNQHIGQLTHERDTLDASLKQESFQRKRCVEHNARFAQLAEELVKQYENKGILGTLGQIEPFTQLKKVELEKMCQEYRDKIDDNTLPKK